MTLLHWVGIVAFVIFFFGGCVFIHEMGHLLAALWRGIHVESFSIGFGKRLWGFKWRGIDFKISLLPFGGYVELPQLETAESWKDSAGNDLAEVKPVDRLITAFAGPFFNILFGLFLGLFVWWVGVDMPKPASEVTVSWVDPISPEYKAGLRAGDRIFQVNGQKIDRGWAQVNEAILISDNSQATVEFYRNETAQSITYDLEASLNPAYKGLPEPNFRPEGRVLLAVLKDSPAEKAGLETEDEILKINGHEIKDTAAVSRMVNELDGKDLVFEVKRGDETISTDPFQAKPDYSLGLVFKEDYENDNGLEIARVDAESPLLDLGVKAGDFVVSFNGTKVVNRDGLQQISENLGDEQVTLELLQSRDGNLENRELSVKPRKRLIAGVAVVMQPYIERVHMSPIAQFNNVIDKTIRTIKALVSPDSKVNITHMSGPLGIVKALGQTASTSFIHGLFLVVFISYSLAIMNLLPLPVLDGGHITFSIMELIFRRKLPISLVKKVETVFALSLMAFMLFVTAQDILGFLPGDQFIVI